MSALNNLGPKAVFGSRKSISGKYSIFRKCYFPKRKTFSCVWLSKNSFYGKLISVFGSFKHFYRKCIKFGKRNKTQQKKMNQRRATSSAIAVQRATSDERCDRRLTSTLVGCAPLIDRAACRRGAIDDRCSPIWALSSLTLSLIWALSSLTLSLIWALSSLSLSLSLFPEMN